MQTKPQQDRNWHTSEHGGSHCYRKDPLTDTSQILTSHAWIVMKEDIFEEAMETFHGSNLNITREGKQQLGSAVGTNSFVESFVKSKVDGWVKEIEALAEIAVTQPHAAFAAFTHCVKHKWNFIVRTTPGIGDLLQPLEDKIVNCLLPAITGRDTLSSIERELLALPARLGGMGIPNPTLQAHASYLGSKRITAPLAALIIQQSGEIPEEIKMNQAKEKRQVRHQRPDEEKKKQEELLRVLPPSLKRAVELAYEKGPSIWLTALPLKEYGFLLHKGDFHDAIHLRYYGWQPGKMPRNCVCGKHFSVDHSMTCPCGGFPTLCHNELCNITAKLMTEVCHNVGIEPNLQPLSGERLQQRSANCDDGARLDIVADNFWGDGRRAFFDVRVFYPLAQSYRQISVEACYRSREQERGAAMTKESEK